MKDILQEQEAEEILRSIAGENVVQSDDCLPVKEVIHKHDKVSHNKTKCLVTYNGGYLDLFVRDYFFNFDVYAKLVETYEEEKMDKITNGGQICPDTNFEEMDKFVARE
ncbi:unnamed protein product [Cochlearia groenlandica]